VLVRVAHDESRRREDEHGDVPTELVAVEGGLVVDDVRHERFACEGGFQGIGNERRVVAAALNIPAKLPVQGARIRHAVHHPIPGRAPPRLPTGTRSPLPAGRYGAGMGLSLSDEVLDAQREGRPVVALESTIISHGLPRPENLRVARAVEQVIREHGATPATIAVLDGVVHVGLSDDDLVRVAEVDDIVKVSVRDIATVVARKGNAATTVAATSHIAHLAGIGVFATGGLGGVHRQARETWDESADLTSLSVTPMTVVCSGVKSILDVPATLERLETLNVAVVGYGTNSFPGFYLTDSGSPIDWRVDDPVEIARIAAVRSQLSVPGALIVANPLPEDLQMDPDLHDRLLAEGLALAETAAIRGKDVTPFLLDHFHRASGGISLEANTEIILRNADLAARIAVANA
jgi:pseudouridine-5'-phosphate glycosidase